MQQRIKSKIFLERIRQLHTGSVGRMYVIVYTWKLCDTMPALMNEPGHSTVSFVR
jgi:hypothetical protein